MNKSVVYAYRDDHRSQHDDRRDVCTLVALGHALGGVFEMLMRGIRYRRKEIPGL